MKKNAFSFVELIVSITLSIILMTAIGVFVIDGVKNITLQKKIVENDIEFDNFKDLFNNTLDSSISGVLLNSGVLLKNQKSYDKGGFSYIGEKFFTGFYCSGTDNDITKHLIIKNFVPFESVNTDIFLNGYNYDDGIYKISYFSGIISNGTNIFTGIYFGPSDLVFGNGNDMYVSDTLNHTILKFDKTSTSTLPQIILGKSSVFGYEYASGTTGTQTLLNNPTGLAFGDDNLFVADTLNDRILYLSGGLAYTLLDRYDSLREPTGIYYDSGTLYISNSAKGEVLAYYGGEDNNLFTKSDNVLKVLKYGLSYPTGINNLYVNDFLARKKIYLNSSSDTALSQFDFSKLAYNKYSDYILNTPINFLELDYTNSLFTMNLKYYKNYSCNNKKDNILRTYLIKKKF